MHISTKSWPALTCQHSTWSGGHFVVMLLFPKGFRQAINSSIRWVKCPLHSSSCHSPALQPFHLFPRSKRYNKGVNDTQKSQKDMEQ